MRRQDDDPFTEPDREWREVFFRHSVRLLAAFVILIAAVFAAFRWSGAAVRFGAARAAGSPEPTWHVTGTIRDASTGKPIPWARVEDHPQGRPPLFRADADHTGRFDLLTLAEPHQILVSAPRYRSVSAKIGRPWYVWLPKGKEKHDIQLTYGGG